MTGLPGVRTDLAAAGLELVRAWPRGPGHLLLHVRAAHDGPGPGHPGSGGRSSDEWSAGQWFADDARAAQVAARTPTPGGSGRSSGSSGSSGSAAAGVRHLVGTGLVLQPGGADRRLPALGPLLDGTGATLVAHRPERRAVVRSADGTRFTKVVRPERVDALAASACWRPAGVDVPEVLDVDRTAGTVTTAAAPGRTLHELGGGADRGAWSEVGRAVAALHASAPPAGAGRHDVDTEAGVTRTWLERAVGHRAMTPAQVAHLWSLAGAAAGRLAAGPPSTAPVTTHRDLHDKQVLLAGGTGGTGGWSVSVLDLDLVAVAEPGVDLANLLVHLTLRDLQAGLRHDAAPARAQERAEAFLDGYGPVPDPHRVADLAVLAAARVAAVYAFRAPLGPGRTGDDDHPRPGDDVGGADLGERLVTSVGAGVPGLGRPGT